MNKQAGALGVLLSLVTMNGWAVSAGNHVLAESHRVIAGGREVLVSVGQDEIKANLNRSNILFSREDQMFVGVLGAAGLANARLRRSTTEQQMAAPLQEALSEFDFDSLAEQQTTTTLSGIDWLLPLHFTFTKKTSVESKLVMLGAIDSSEMIMVDYEYGMSERFKAVELNCRISIANKHQDGDLKSNGRLNASSMIYTQLHKVVVPLDQASSDPGENLARWSSEQALRTRKALETAVAKVQEMIRRGLTQSKRDERMAETGKRVGNDSYQGRLIEYKDGNILMRISEPDDLWVNITSSIQ